MNRTKWGNNAFIEEKGRRVPIRNALLCENSKDQLVWISWDLGYREGTARRMQGKRSVNERMQHG